VEEGDEILHGRLLELAVEEEACAARRWSRAGSAASSLPRLRPMAARAREGAGEEGSGVGTSLLSPRHGGPGRFGVVPGGSAPAIWWFISECKICFVRFFIFFM